MLTIEVDILAGVDGVEARDPEHHPGRQPERERSQLAGDRQPGAHRGDGQTEAEHQVRVGREALGVGVAQNDQQGDGTEDEADRVEHPGRQDEQAAGHQHQQTGATRRYQARRQVSIVGAGVGGVEATVDQTVEGHGGAACGDHGHQDQQQDAPRRSPGRGDQQGQQGKGQGEERVLELDQPQIPTQNRHSRYPLSFR